MSHSLEKLTSKCAIYVEVIEDRSDRCRNYMVTLY